MASVISMKIGIDGENEFKASLQNIIQQTKTLDAEMKATTAAFTKDTTEKQKAVATADALKKQIEAQTEKIKLLEQGLEAATNKYGENSTEALKWQEQLNKSSAELSTLKNELEDVDKHSGKFENLKKGAEIAGKAFAALAATAAATATAVGAAAIELGKKVVQSFGELEQNLGGSEAVFGEYAASLQKTAEDAYRTMGTTESEYLATANKMGALFQGSGVETERSMELTTLAMQRAADMASVMGIDTTSALEAVTGAAKGNYTMMDNLGVAMNATTLEAYAVAQGMETAFKDMSNAEKAELAMKYFFENTEQYAGNFEREASSTISGSIGMLTASWSSFIAGLGNSDADIKNLAQNIIDAFMSVVSNVSPVIQNIARSIPTVVAALGDALASALPTLLESASSLFQALLESLSTDALPAILPIVTDVLMLITETIISNLPLLLDSATQIIISLSDGISSALPRLIPVAIDAVILLVKNLIQNAPLLIESALRMIEALADGLVNDALPTLIQSAPVLIESLITGFIDHLDEFIVLAVNIAGTLAIGLIQAIPELIKAIPQLIKSIIDAFKNNDWAATGKNIVDGIIDGLGDAASRLWEAAKDLAKKALQKVKDALKIGSPSKVFEKEVGKMIPAGITVGVEKGTPSMVSTLKDSMIELAGIPSKVGVQSNGINDGGNNITVNQNFYKERKMTAYEVEREARIGLRKVGWEMA